MDSRKPRRSRAPPVQLIVEKNARNSAAMAMSGEDDSVIGNGVTNSTIARTAIERVMCKVSEDTSMQTAVQGGVQTLMKDAIETANNTEHRQSVRNSAANALPKERTPIFTDTAPMLVEGEPRKSNAIPVQFSNARNSSSSALPQGTNTIDDGGNPAETPTELNQIRDSAAMRPTQGSRSGSHASSDKKTNVTDDPEFRLLESRLAFAESERTNADNEKHAVNLLNTQMRADLTIKSARIDDLEQKLKLSNERNRALENEISEQRVKIKLSEEREKLRERYYGPLDVDNNPTDDGDGNGGKDPQSKSYVVLQERENRMLKAKNMDLIEQLSGATTSQAQQLQEISRLIQERSNAERDSDKALNEVISEASKGRMELNQEITKLNREKDKLESTLKAEIEALKIEMDFAVKRRDAVEDDYNSMHQKFIGEQERNVELLREIDEVKDSYSRMLLDAEMERKKDLASYQTNMERMLEENRGLQNLQSLNNRIKNKPPTRDGKVLEQFRIEQKVGQIVQKYGSPTSPKKDSAEKKFASNIQDFVANGITLSSPVNSNQESNPNSNPHTANDDGHQDEGNQDVNEPANHAIDAHHDYKLRISDEFAQIGKFENFQDLGEARFSLQGDLVVERKPGDDELKEEERLIEEARRQLAVEKKILEVRENRKRVEEESTQAKDTQNRMSGPSKSMYNALIEEQMKMSKGHREIDEMLNDGFKKVNPMSADAILERKLDKLERIPSPQEPIHFQNEGTDLTKGDKLSLKSELTPFLVNANLAAEIVGLGDVDFALRDIVKGKNRGSGNLIGNHQGQKASFPDQIQTPRSDPNTSFPDPANRSPTYKAIQKDLDRPPANRFPPGESPDDIGGKKESGLQIFPFNDKSNRKVNEPRFADHFNLIDASEYAGGKNNPYLVNSRTNSYTRTQHTNKIVDSFDRINQLRAEIHVEIEQAERGGYKGSPSSPSYRGDTTNYGGRDHKSPSTSLANYSPLSKSPLFANSNGKSEKTLYGSNINKTGGSDVLGNLQRIIGKDDDPGKAEFFDNVANLGRKKDTRLQTADKQLAAKLDREIDMCLKSELNAKGYFKRSQVLEGGSRFDPPREQKKDYNRNGNDDENYLRALDDLLDPTSVNAIPSIQNSIDRKKKAREDKRGESPLLAGGLRAESPIATEWSNSEASKPIDLRDKYGVNPKISNHIQYDYDTIYSTEKEVASSRDKNADTKTRPMFYPEPDSSQSLRLGPVERLGSLEIRSSIEPQRVDSPKGNSFASKGNSYSPKRDSYHITDIFDRDDEEYIDLNNDLRNSKSSLISMGGISSIVGRDRSEGHGDRSGHCRERNGNYDKSVGGTDRSVGGMSPSPIKPSPNSTRNDEAEFYEMLATPFKSPDCSQLGRLADQIDGCVDGYLRQEW